MAGLNILDINIYSWLGSKYFMIFRLFLSENWTTSGFVGGRQRVFLRVFEFKLRITLLPFEDRICLVEGT